MSSIPQIKVDCVWSHPSCHYKWEDLHLKISESELWPIKTFEFLDVYREVRNSQALFLLVEKVQDLIMICGSLFGMHGLVLGLEICLLVVVMLMTVCPRLTGHIDSTGMGLISSLNFVAHLLAVNRGLRRHNYHLSIGHKGWFVDSTLVKVGCFYCRDWLSLVLIQLLHVGFILR